MYLYSFAWFLVDVCSVFKIIKRSNPNIFLHLSIFSMVHPTHPLSISLSSSSDHPWPSCQASARGCPAPMHHTSHSSRAPSCACTVHRPPGLCVRASLVVYLAPHALLGSAHTCDVLALIRARAARLPCLSAPCRHHVCAATAHARLHRASSHPTRVATCRDGLGPCARPFPISSRT
jgi:hypothetical protein